LPATAVQRVELIPEPQQLDWKRQKRSVSDRQAIARLRAFVEAATSPAQFKSYKKVQCFVEFWWRNFVSSHFEHTHKALPSGCV
jgi:hypothetical protein